MPYDPNPKVDKSVLIAEQRVRIYWLTLLSGLTSVLALTLHLLAINNFSLTGFIIGSMAGSLIFAGIRGYTDDYYQQLVTVGMRWTMVALGIAVLALWAHGETALVARLLPAVKTLAADTYLLVLILGVVFHAGYCFAYLRDLAAGTSEP